MAAVAIPNISSDDYQAFKTAGVRSQFPDDFDEFLVLINQRRKFFKDKGVVTYEVNIDFAGFHQWLAPRVLATFNDLFTYTATIQR